jgi:hypothetical protein
MPPYQQNNTELYYRLIEILNDNIVNIRKQNVRVKWEKIVEDSLYSYRNLCKNSKNKSSKIKKNIENEEFYLNFHESAKNSKKTKDYKNDNVVESSKKVKFAAADRVQEEKITEKHISTKEYKSFADICNSLSDSSMSESEIVKKIASKKEKKSNEFGTTITTDDTEISKINTKVKKTKKKIEKTDKEKQKKINSENAFTNIINPNLVSHQIVTGNFPQYPIYGYQPFYPQLQVQTPTYLNYPVTHVFPQNYIMTNNLMPQYQLHPMHIIPNCKLPIVNLNNQINYHSTDNKLSNSSTIVPSRNTTNK